MNQLFEVLKQFRDELFRQLSVRDFVGLSVTCFVAGISYVQHRTIRWLREHSERERLRAERLRLDDTQREYFRHKETVRAVFESSSAAQARTLDELLQNTEGDWSLRSSGASSVPPEPPLTEPPTMAMKPRP